MCVGDTTSVADEREDPGQGHISPQGAPDEEVCAHRDQDLIGPDSNPYGLQADPELSSAADRNEELQADQLPVQTEEDDIKSPSANAGNERRSQQPEDTLSEDRQASSPIVVTGERAIRKQGPEERVRSRESPSPDVVVKEEPVSPDRYPIVKEEPPFPTAEIDPITGRPVVDLTGDDANPEAETGQAVDLQPSRPIKKRRTAPPPLAIPTSRRRAGRSDEPAPDLSWRPDAEQEDLDESPPVNLMDIPSYPGSLVEAAERGAEASQSAVGRIPSRQQSPVETAAPGAETSQGGVGRSRRRKRKAPAQPTRWSRRLRGEPPEYSGLEPVKRRKVSRR